MENSASVKKYVCYRKKYRISEWAMAASRQIRLFYYKSIVIVVIVGGANGLQGIVLKKLWGHIGFFHTFSPFLWLRNEQFVLQ